MKRPILVTGAGGNVGREVVRALTAAGLPLRAADFAPKQCRALLSGEVEVAHLDFMAPSTWPRALDGCDRLFLLRPPAIADVKRTLNPFVDAARSAGVGHVVFLSVAGADDNRFIPHHKVERHLKSTGVKWTMLRPGFFAQNLQDAYRRDIVDDDRLLVPAGRGKVAFVDLHDVAEVAALVFADPGQHAGEAYTLTGPAALTFDEVAATLSRILGRPVRYLPASTPGYLLHLRRRGIGWGQALVQTILHLGLRRGHAEEVNPTLERLLGRPGRTLETYVRQNATTWASRPPGAGTVALT